MAEPVSLPGWVRQSGPDLLIELSVQPGARRNGPAGVLDGRLKLSVSAPPVEGAANDAVVRFIARLLGIPKSRLAVIRGTSSRRKTLCCKDCAPELIQPLLSLLADVN